MTPTPPRTTSRTPPRTTSGPADQTTPQTADGTADTDTDRDTATVAPLLAAGGGFTTSRQLRASGIPPARIARLVSRGVLLRLRRDVLVDAAIWTATPRWERHALRARAVLASLDARGTGPLALSHHSALALHGIELFGVDDDVHLVRTDGHRGYHRGGVHVHAPVPPDHVTTVGRLRIVRPATAVMQVTATFGIPAGLVAADSALRRESCTREDLNALLGWPALRSARRATEIVAVRATPAHESAGESRCAWLLHQLGYDAVPQAVVRTQAREFVARVDFALREHRVIVEFDGMGKYADARDLRNEKVREDRLRSLNFEVVRLTWADLDRPAEVRATIDAAIARSFRRQHG